MSKIKLTCNWCDDNTLYKRFISCYPSEYNQISGVEFTNSSNYDWLVIINHPQYAISFPKERTIGIIMEPSWSVHFQKKIILEQYCSYIISHVKEPKNTQYIFYPGLLPFHFNDYTEKNLDYYINKNFLKTKKCSMIVSYYNSNLHPNCIYEQRTNFAKQILNSDLDIDIYGNGWENSGILDKRIKGSLYNKIDGLFPYDFSIAIENCVEENYFTEKLTDCLLTNTTPIYYGCSNIKNFIPDLYQLSTLNNLDELKQILKNPPLKFDKKKLAIKYNLYAAIASFLKKKNTMNNFTYK